MYYSVKVRSGRDGSLKTLKFFSTKTVKTFKLFWLIPITYQHEEAGPEDRDMAIDFALKQIYSKKWQDVFIYLTYLSVEADRVITIPVWQNERWI